MVYGLHLTAMSIPPSLSSLAHDALNHNLPTLVNIGLVLLAALTWLRTLWSNVSKSLEKVCLSTVHIDDDPLYQKVILWMNDHVFKHRNFRSVLAATSNVDEFEKGGNYGGVKYDMRLTSKASATASELETNSAGESMDQRLADIQLKPFHGSRLFTFKGKWILFTHSAPSTPSPILDEYYGGKKPNPHLKLQTLSLSLHALETFLHETHLYARRTSHATVSVHRAIANARDIARDIARWGHIVSKPARDIPTVILDARKKNALLHDVTEYLRPRTRQWYANHGIPYRRGYLFSGPPGTGKTSLASAIAGVFGLDIYVLSLLDPKITESQFVRLFSEAPARCVVLLEDIDSATLSQARADKSIREANNHNKDNSSSTSSISLSALFNAIDGVSSHEGHILIMTTNLPQNLDRALVRPGRVDMHFQFDLPSYEELRSLFLSIYNDVEIVEVGQVETPNENEDGNEKKKTEQDLQDLATRFAEKLPE